jgi:type IV pilus assembly protein PilY1
MKGIVAIVIMMGAAQVGAAQQVAPAAVAAESEGAPDVPGCASSGAGHSVRVDYDYALTAAGGSGTLIFEGARDGTLRATEGPGGRVLWSFVPPDLAPSTGSRMTDLAVLRFDSNNDGLIDASAGDRVWLYFGLKRGGARYYALDVSTRTPRLLWTVGADTLVGLGEAWAAPTIARMRVGGATQNGEHFVLVLGGGYRGGYRGAAVGAGEGASAAADEGVGADADDGADADADGDADAGAGAEASAGADAGASAGADDGAGAGNRLFIVDAATGRLLWTAGDAEGADLRLPWMTHPVAARVTALDLDGDELADRLYAADVGGRIWRFDVWNGRARDQLVSGGIFASLGAGEPLGSPATAADARRFFNAPDVALMHPRGQAPWLNVAIGSGNAADAGATNVRDRFYALRDREPFAKRSQASYESSAPLFDDMLFDLGEAPAGARLPEGSPGWKIDLDGKVLSDSLTVNGVVLFTTYRPAAASGCESEGSGEVYAVTVDTGTAALDLNRDGEVTEGDLHVALSGPGIPGALQLQLPGSSAPGGGSGNPADSGGPGSPGGPGGVGSGGSPPSDPAQDANARCYAGTERLPACMPINTVVRTFWKRTLVH